MFDIFLPGWSLSTAALERIKSYGLHPDWSVLEYGPGISTFVIQEVIKPNRHLCIDEPGPWGEKFLKVAPASIDYEVRPLNDYYGALCLYDLILIDGPAVFDYRGVAYQSIIDCSHSKSILIIDDCHRKEEAKLAIRLKNTGNWNAIVVKDTEFARSTIFLEPK